jgi:hypothetical protein
MCIIITNNIVDPLDFSPITRLRAGQLRIGGRILIIDETFFCSPKILHRLWETRRFLLKG